MRSRRNLRSGDPRRPGAALSPLALPAIERQQQMGLNAPLLRRSAIVAGHLATGQAGGVPTYS
eukprot:6579446-Alexandrium_andersonii.AAC.1